MSNILFISLGCDKNLVDSEKMIGLLAHSGHRIVDREEEADVIVINSCCFIHDAKEESIETILSIAEWKKKGRLKALIVAGCLAQRYAGEMEEEIPEVDAIIGTAGYDRIVSVVDEILKEQTEGEGDPAKGMIFCLLHWLTGEWSAQGLTQPILKLPKAAISGALTVSYLLSEEATGASLWKILSGKLRSWLPGEFGNSSL